MDDSELKDSFSQDPSTTNPHVKILTYDESATSVKEAKDQIKNNYPNADLESGYAKNWYSLNLFNPKKEKSDEIGNCRIGAASQYIATFFSAGLEIASRNPDLEQIMYAAIPFGLLEGVRNIYTWMNKKSVREAQKEKNIVDNLEKAEYNENFKIEEVPEAKELYKKAREQYAKAHSATMNIEGSKHNEPMKSPYVEVAFNTGAMNSKLKEIYEKS